MLTATLVVALMRSPRGLLFGASRVALRLRRRIRPSADGIDGVG
jgi:hypothetical protein